LDVCKGFVRLSFTFAVKRKEGKRFSFRNIVLYINMKNYAEFMKDLLLTALNLLQKMYRKK